MPESYCVEANISAVIDAYLYCFFVSHSFVVQGMGSANLISPLSLQANCSYVIPSGIVYTFFSSDYTTGDDGSSFYKRLIIESYFRMNKSTKSV